MKILVVDDDPAALAIISSMVEHLGFEAVEAESGEEALDQLVDPDISMILCDWEMPGMNGIDVCRHIREESFERYIYLILVTGRSEKEHLIEGLNAGADDFVSKPVNPDEMRVRLRGAQRVVDLERTLDARNEKLKKANRQIADAFDSVKQDLRLAAEMQYSMLPKAKSVNNLKANWVFKPASFIAGDMFDYFPIADEKFVFYIIDVEGHGIPSALTSFAVNNVLNPSTQGMCSRHLHSSTDTADAVLKTVCELNRHFTNSESTSRYFTMIYGVLDQKTGEVTMTQAGHPPALHYSASRKEVVEIGDGGMPLGMFEMAQFTTTHCTMSPGDRLYIYSDGTIECPATDGEMYGNDRLNEKIVAWGDIPIDDINQELDREFLSWNGSSQFEDDVSMVCLEYQQQ